MLKKEAKLLLGKAIDSLTLSVEHFNRPWDCGRVHTVLILTDHAFEMLLKAAIIHRGGKIRQLKKKETIGFDACVRKLFSDADVKFLTEEQVLLLQSMNSLRDAAQHHLLGISEQHLYIQSQAGLTLFRDILKSVFGKDLKLELPSRVLPLSTTAPTDLSTLFDTEMKEVQALLRPGKRKGVEANAKLRALAIVEGAIQGEKLQPGKSDLDKIKRLVRDGRSWEQIFPGVASINITRTGYGPSIDLRITKKEGIPFHTVPEGTPSAHVIGIKRVNELDFYNLGRDQLAEKLGLTGPKTTALIRYLKLQDDQECFKSIKIGQVKFKRYSNKALDLLKKEIKAASSIVDDAWQYWKIEKKASHK